MIGLATSKKTKQTMIGLATSEDHYKHFDSLACHASYMPLFIEKETCQQTKSDCTHVHIKVVADHGDRSQWVDRKHYVSGTE